MSYQSRLGCLLYLDEVVGDRCLCEPTMLFILGLEAVTTPQNEYLKAVPVLDPITEQPIIDTETLQPVIELVTDEDRLNTIVIRKDRVNDLFASIADYLQYCNIGKIVDLSEDVIRFDCNNLKVFMNEKTGTDKDRICPVVLHEYNEEINLEPIDKNDIYNSLAKRISEILSRAGYDVSDTEVPILGKGLITDEGVLNAINEYNSNLISSHKAMKADRELYKLLDYKAMYSYALGVLYGCGNITAWRTDPSEWYKGEYSNLVKTAYEIFKFHYKHPIPKIDNDEMLFIKYKGIKLNKLWNFDNDTVEIKSDEKNCKVLYIENDEVIEKPIIYSKSTGPQKPIPGSYLSDEYNWVPLDNEVICNDPKKGIVHNCEKPIIRYIAHTKVEIKRAYQYSSHKYLSPNKKEIYFTDICKIGWLDFDCNSFRNSSYLQLYEADFDHLPVDNFNNAIRKLDGKVLGYYKVLINGDIELYCILDSKITRLADRWSFDTVSDSFIQILTKSVFDNEFYHTQDTFSPTEDVFKLWDTDNPMWLYLSPHKTNCTIPVINGNSRKASSLIYNTGSYSADDQTYMEALEPGTLGNNLSVSILWQSNWSGRAGYQVTVYNNTTVVYSSPYRIQSFSEAQNNYVSFAGGFPSAPFWTNGMSFKWYLSSGIDEDTVGIPLYYEDGTQVKSNSLVSYRVTEILQKKYVKDYSSVYTDSFSISVNDIKFVTDDSGNLLLQYSGESDIAGIYGFSFICDNL